MLFLFGASCYWLPTRTRRYSGTGQAGVVWLHIWSALATSSVFKNPHLLINMRSADLDTEKYSSSSRLIFSQRVSGTSANPNGWMGGNRVSSPGGRGLARFPRGVQGGACVRLLWRHRTDENAEVSMRLQDVGRSVSRHRPQRGLHARKARSNQTTSWRWSDLSDHN